MRSARSLTRSGGPGICRRLPCWGPSASDGTDPVRAVLRLALLGPSGTGRLLTEGRSVELFPDRRQGWLHGVATLPVGPVHHQRMAADVGGKGGAEIGGGPCELA